MTPKYIAGKLDVQNQLYRGSLSDKKWQDWREALARSHNDPDQKKTLPKNVIEMQTVKI